MKLLALAASLAAAAAGAAFLVAAAPDGAGAALQPAAEWAADPVWYDGLVEKATYDATMVIYGRPRPYQATFLTNKEKHDAATLTKDADGQGESIEVWKHNQIEVVPTPNYDYKFVTTTHATTADLGLTRLDASSQEWCGTSFKQYLKDDGGLDYQSLSYMPEEGRRVGGVSKADLPAVPFDGLPLFLRGYDFDGRGDLNIRLLPGQKSNRAVPFEPSDAVVRHAGEAEGGGHKLDLLVGGETTGTFTFADDRRHVMLAYDGANGDSYRLTDLERVDYWTRDE